MSNIGKYVTYKGNNYIVVSEGVKQVKINSINHRMLQVNKASVQPMKCKPATVKAYEGADYIVTGARNIFSVDTGKLIKWSEDHGIRKALLANPNPF